MDSSMAFTELVELTRTDKYVQYELFFGPNFPGMHGNFGYVLDVAGSTITKVRPNPGLLHRGFEKLMEQKLWLQNLSLIPRICVPDPDPKKWLLQRVEKIMGIEIPERAKFIRTITLEMSRISAFSWLGALRRYDGPLTLVHVPGMGGPGPGRQEPLRKLVGMGLKGGKGGYHILQ